MYRTQYSRKASTSILRKRTKGDCDDYKRYLGLENDWKPDFPASRRTVASSPGVPSKADKQE